jgi:hypothetical protein
MEVSVARLKQKVERQHGGKAVLVATLPVKDTFEGATVWVCVVHIFDLAGHPKAADSDEVGRAFRLMSAT